MINVPMATAFAQAITELRSGINRKERIWEILVWLLFSATCLQVAFLFPDAALSPEHREKLLSGLMCALSLTFACLVFGKGHLDARKPEFIVSVVLSIIVIASSILSSTPGPSSRRGFVMLAAGLGGFWCARILLVSAGAQRFFTFFCILILGGLVGTALAGYFFVGDTYQLLDSGPHPVACRMFLLWFAPLSLLFDKERRAWIFSAILLPASYAVLYLSSLRSGIVISFVSAISAAAAGMVRFRHLVMLLIPLVILAVFFIQGLPAEKIGREYEPAYYRVESYPFSLHIALQHPILGIGLRAPREGFLDGYQIKYPYLTKEQFSDSLKRIQVAESIYLSLMVDLGFPFVILYVGSVAFLVTRLIRAIRRRPPGLFVHPAALLLSIVAGLVYFLVWDGQYHPQVNWFFHLLLGMIPAEKSDG